MPLCHCLTLWGSDSSESPRYSACETSRASMPWAAGTPCSLRHRYQRCSFQTPSFHLVSVAQNLSKIPLLCMEPAQPMGSSGPALLLLLLLSLQQEHLTCDTPGVYPSGPPKPQNFKSHIKLESSCLLPVCAFCPV